MRGWSTLSCVRRCFGWALVCADSRDSGGRSVAHWRCFERCATVLDVNLEAHRFAAEFFHQLVAVVFQLRDEFFVGHVFGGLAAAAFELDEFLIDLSEI